MSRVAALAPAPKPRDVEGAALSRMRLGIKSADLLERAALTSHDPECLAVADMLREAAQLENIYTAADMHNDDGECFDSYGSLNLAPSRLDPAYMKATSARARRKAREAIKLCRPQSGERLRFLTLTMPRVAAPFDQVLEVFDAALVLLKKRKWFKANIRGAVIGAEFTLGEAGDHYHIHAHALTWSKWINWVELGEQWTLCLEAAAARLGVELQIGTEHGRAVVDVRLVTSKRRGKGTVSMDDAVQETCKYIVKGSDFEKIPPADLCAVERALYRRRMVETFGECNRQRGRAAEATDTYLDTHNITDGSDYQPGAEPDASPFVLATKKPRSAPLRQIGAEMIRAGRRDLWLELLREVYRQRRAFRKTQLAERYPFATFRTLAGEVWRGREAVRQAPPVATSPHAVSGRMHPQGRSEAEDGEAVA